jgi:nucleoid DNA-binding protein
MPHLKFPEEIIEQVAKEHKLPIHVVERMIRHQFWFVKDCIEKGYNVRLHKFGAFTPKKSCIDKLKV